MNAKILIAVAAVAAAVSGVARADDAPLSSQFATRIDGTRTRAEVAAEAVQAVAGYNPEPAGSRVLVVAPSTVSKQAVRAQAAEALRLGQIPSGEMSF